MTKAKQSPKKITEAKKPKKVKKIPGGRGVVHAKFSFNNTILRLSHENGDVLGKTISSGSIGYKNTKKGTPYAAQECAEKAIKEALEYGIYNVKLQVKGIGSGRNKVIEKFLENKSLSVDQLIDKTPEQHGGCRPRKTPRK